MTDASTATGGRRRSSGAMITRLSAMMFLQYWPLGIWYVTVWTFIDANTGDGKIFSAGFVGYSASAAAIGCLVAPALFGWVADRFLAAERMLTMLHVGAALALWWMHESMTQTAFFTGMLLYFQCYAPSGALTNTIALRKLTDSDREFPTVRLFGTVAWIAQGVFIGVVCLWWTGVSVEPTRLPIALGAYSHVVMALYSLTLPHTPPEPRRTTRKAKGGMHRNRAFMLFLLVSLLAAIPSQFYNFAIVFLEKRGFVGGAATLTMGQLTEVICLAATPFLLMRWRLKALFLIGVLGWSLRYVFLAMASYGPPETAVVSPVYLAILLHGPSYVFVQLAGQMYVDKLADPSNRGAAQGLHSLATGGFGYLLGAGAAGLAQAAFLTPPGVTPAPYHWIPFWLTPVGIAVASAVLFALVFFERPHERAVEDGAEAVE